MFSQLPGRPSSLPPRAMRHVAEGGGGIFSACYRQVEYQCCLCCADLHKDGALQAHPLRMSSRICAFVKMQDYLPHFYRYLYLVCTVTKVKVLATNIWMGL